MKILSNVKLFVFFVLLYKWDGYIYFIYMFGKYEIMDVGKNLKDLYFIKLFLRFYR